MLFLDLDFTEKALRTLGAFLCRVIYQIVAFAYQLFMDISKFPYLISTHEIYEKIVMILTIVMVFYVTFEFVKYIVQPDTMTDKEKGAGNIVGRMVGVVLLLAFVPSIFSFAFKMQNVIIDSQIFSKVFLGKINYDSESLGKTFAYDVFSTFYYYDEDLWGENQECDGVPCQAIVNSNYSALSNTGKLPYLSIGLNESAKLEDIDTEVLPSSTEEPLIHFDAVFAVVVGGFLAYILILYCVDLGVRVAQMLYLQIIAPIPIMGFLIPKKDGIFQKWTKQCLTTYLDIFIRLSLIYFIILLSETLMASEVFDNFGATRGWVKVAIIMGLLLFAQKAPKMLEELFPKGNAASGNLGLKATDRVAPAVARTLGASAGGLNRLARNAVARGVSTHKKNQEIKDKLMEQGKDPTKSAIRKARKNARQELRSSSSNYRTARRELIKANKNAQDITDPAERKEKLREEQQAYNEARKKFHNDREKLTDAKQNTQRNVFAQAALGAASGAKIGAQEGWKAKKLEEVGKQIKEGNKAAEAALKARETFIDNGGGSDFDLLKSKFEQGLGIRTEAQTMGQEIKTLESRAKTLENINENEKAVIASGDKVKDNDLKKLKEGKLLNEIASTGELKMTDGSTFAVTAGETVSAAFGRVSANMTMAEERLKAATEAHSKAKTQAAKDKAEVELEAAQKNYSSMKIQEEQVGKKLHEIAFGQMLAAIAAYDKDPKNSVDPRTRADFDQGSVQAAYETIWSIQNARKNPSTVEAMTRILSADDLAAFKGEKAIEDFDTYDRIEKALKRSTGERMEQITEAKNEQQRLSTSDAYAAAKAADEAAGGKK